MEQSGWGIDISRISPVDRPEFLLCNDFVGYFQLAFAVSCHYDRNFKRHPTVTMFCRAKLRTWSACRTSYVCKKMIKRIELVNFMSHVHTVIEPADGLTVLVGPNNCGKSAVMTAMQILCHNAPSTYVTRHGEKECSIKVLTSDGHEIEWSRNRTSSKYVINGETFDRLRGKVPEKLLEVLRLPKVQLEQSDEEFDIHFGSQKEPIFLLNKTGRAAAGFFAASSDASRLIEMQKLHRQKVKDATRDLNRLELEAKSLELNVEALSPVPALKTQFAKLAKEEVEIANAEQTAARIKTSLKQIADYRRSSVYLADCTKVVAGLAEPPVLEPTERLRDLTAQLRRSKRTLQRLEKASDSLKPLGNAPELEPTAGLEKLVRGIRRQDSQCSQLAARQSVLAKGKQPPKVPDTQRLRELLAGLRVQRRSVSVAAATGGAVKDLSPPPLVGETKALQNLIAQCRTVEKEVSLLEKEFKPIEKSVAKLDRQLEKYSATNPVCPTCHQPLSQKQIVDTVKGGKDG